MKLNTEMAKEKNQAILDSLMSNLKFGVENHQFGSDNYLELKN